MGAPNTRSYQNSSGEYTITVSSADAATGTVSGNYQATTSPVGAVQASITGVFAFVKGGGEPPYPILLHAQDRPDGWPYCLIDSWTGACLADGNMELEGERSYVTKNGEVEISQLGKHTFEVTPGSHVGPREATSDPKLTDKSDPKLTPKQMFEMFELGGGDEGVEG